MAERLLRTVPRMPPTDEPPAPNVPIDYTALLCRRPSGAVSIPDQPEKLAFLQRIYEENDQGSTRPDDSAGLARMGGSGVEERVPHDLDIGVDLFPPDNFAMVNSWLYRSSFPKKKHFPFLKTLGLRSVLYVCPLTSTLILEDYPEQNAHFLDENGITFFQYGIPGNKEPFVQSRPHDLPSSRGNHHGRAQHHFGQTQSPDADPLQQGQAPHRVHHRLPPQTAAMVAHHHIRRVPPL